MTHTFRCAAALFFLASANVAWSEVVPPDAGRLLQDQRPPLSPPEPSSSTLRIVPVDSADVPPGGAKAVINVITFNGHSLFSEDALLAALGEVRGQSFDLAGLRGLADKISAFYRASGYPFAKAYVPPQPLTGGRLRIEIVEGRYGAVTALGEDTVLREGAQSALAPLRPGDVIDGELLERTTLLMQDRPGIKVSPIIRPGNQVGSGDLEVYVERDSGFSGEVSVDNQGNRYTGQYRVGAELQWDSPFRFGDQLTFNALYSNQDMWLGGMNYSIPLTADGLRAILGYSHTAYELAEDFEELQATGTADITIFGLTYPVVRSQRASLTLGASLQYKALNDKQQIARIDDDKSSTSLPLHIRFDRRDQLGGGGLTYGNLTYTTGRLKLGQALNATDISSGQNTRGHFDKWNLDLARVQATPLTPLTFYVRLSAQWAGKNLDSSESFSLGGSNGVRAYPSGEGSGDEGWLTQMEVRYTQGAVTGYFFHDVGRTKTNAKPARPSDDVTRLIAGSGIGVRYQRAAWNMDASYSWRDKGGVSQADTKDLDPRLWLKLSYRF